MNQIPLSPAERDAIIVVTASLKHKVVPPVSASSAVRDFVRLILAIGEEPWVGDDVSFRRHLILKIRRTMVALQLQGSEEMFQVAKAYVLAQPHQKDHS